MKQPIQTAKSIKKGPQSVLVTPKEQPKRIQEITTEKANNLMDVINSDHPTDAPPKKTERFNSSILADLDNRAQQTIQPYVDQPEEIIQDICKTEGTFELEGIDRVKFQPFFQNGNIGTYCIFELPDSIFCDYEACGIKIGRQGRSPLVFFASGEDYSKLPGIDNLISEIWRDYDMCFRARAASKDINFVTQRIIIGDNVSLHGLIDESHFDRQSFTSDQQQWTLMDIAKDMDKWGFNKVENRRLKVLSYCSGIWGDTPNVFGGCGPFDGTYNEYMSRVIFGQLICPEYRGQFEDIKIPKGSSIVGKFRPLSSSEDVCLKIIKRYPKKYTADLEYSKITHLYSGKSFYIKSITKAGHLFLIPEVLETPKNPKDIKEIHDFTSSVMTDIHSAFGWNQI